MQIEWESKAGLSYLVAAQQNSSLTNCPTGNSTPANQSPVSWQKYNDIAGLLNLALQNAALRTKRF